MRGTHYSLRQQFAQKKIKAKYVYELINNGSEEGKQVYNIILGLGAGSAVAAMGLILSIYEFTQGNYFRGLSGLGITHGLSFLTIQTVVGQPQDPDPAIYRGPERPTLT